MSKQRQTAEMISLPTKSVIPQERKRYEQRRKLQEVYIPVIKANGVPQKEVTPIHLNGKYIAQRNFCRLYKRFLP